MSTYLGNYENQREGFKKLYRKYSDEMWENGIDLIKYITKRGGSMNFGQEPKFTPVFIYFIYLQYKNKKEILLISYFFR